MEALELGLPAIVKDNSGAQELLKYGCKGISVYTENLCDILLKEVHDYSKLGSNVCKSKLPKRFSREEALSAVIKALHEES